jgi:hypothetical protein
MFDGSVYLISGVNAVQISGQTIIALVSGNAVVTSVSGNLILASVSGNMISISGQPISTSVSGNMISVSGQPLSVSVSGNMISVSGQPLTVSGNAVNTSGQTVYLVSGQNAITTFTPATYVALFDNIVPTSGGVLAAMVYKSGSSVISMKKLFVTNIEPGLISGQYIRFDMCRISGLFSGGTAISANVMDPRDVSSGASINMVAAPAGGSSSLWPVAARNVIFNWATTTAGWMSGGALSSLAGSINQIGQSFNILPESTEMEELRLTSGYGVMVQQSLAQTNYTQVTSGKYAVTMVYTLQ